MNSTYISLLSQLIQCRPISANIEAVNKATAIMKSFLEENGVNCSVSTMPEGRDVLYASTIFEEKQPEFLFLTHLDVVPAADAMFDPKIDSKGIMRARGCHDCLGNAVMAAKVLCNLIGSGASVGAIFCSNEEIGGSACQFMAQKGYAAKKLIIVADSGAYSIYFSEKGSMNVTMRATGRAGHSSAPWEFDNAIDKLVEGYARLKTAWPKIPDDKWGDSLAATIISAGTVSNRIPDEASMLLNIRFTTFGGENNILNFIRETTGLEAVLTDKVSPPFSVNSDDPQIQSLLRAMKESFTDHNVTLQRMHGATDGRHFAKLGIPIAIIGVEGDGAHDDTEWLRLESVSEYAAMLEGFISKK